MRRWSTVLVLVTLWAAGCGSSGSESSGGSRLTTETTTSEASTTAPTTDDIATADTTSSAPLLDTRWVMLGFDALVDERGEMIVEVDEVALGGTMVERDLDGNVFYATLDGVYRLERGGVEPTKTFQGEVYDLVRDSTGRVLASTTAGTLDLSTGRYVEGELHEVEQRIEATNGMAVEVIPGSFRRDAEGWLTHVERPDGIRLIDQRGDQLTIWELGGPGAPYVSLVDFDGRFVLAARGPEEPALPAWDHVLIDLPNGSVDAFRAVPGTVALATPDDPIAPDVLKIPTIDLCPTWSSLAIKEPDTALPAAVADGYRHITLATARCDTWFIRELDWDDDAGWVALQRSLLGPPTVRDQTWSWESDPAATITVDAQGRVDVMVRADQLNAVHVVRGTTDLVLTGRVGPDSAARLTEAAKIAADLHALHITTYFSDGPELDEATQLALEEFLGTSLGFAGEDVLAVEASLSADTFRVSGIRNDDLPVIVGELAASTFEAAGVDVLQRVGPAEVGLSERLILDELLAFAEGDETAIGRIPWANEVALALGSTLADVRSAEELTDPEVWTLDIGPFRGADGPISLLPRPGLSWSAPTAGAHRHCAAAPVPAPPDLAGLRRISVQVTDVDSCLEWRTLDVFLDSDGLVAGVSADFWEP